MTSKEVQELLSKCKVYIDFGHFPGKDRVPREAAMCNCCIITGKYGASNFTEEKLFGDCFETEDQKAGMGNFLEKDKEKKLKVVPFKNC